MSTETKNPTLKLVSPPCTNSEQKTVILRINRKPIKFTIDKSKWDQKDIRLDLMLPKPTNVDPTMGCIYLLHCTKSNKQYIGETVMYKNKTKGEEDYYEYGPNRRFDMHKYESTTGKDTALIRALREFGSESFEIHTLCYAKIEVLDVLETQFIRFYNTKTPNGYNMTNHGRVTGMSEAAATYYASIATGVKMTAYRIKVVRRIVVLKIKARDGEDYVLTFGYGENDTFENAMKETEKFLRPFFEANVPVYKSDTFLSETIDTQAKSYNVLKESKIEWVTITTAKKTCKDGTVREMVALCFRLIGAKKTYYNKNFQHIKKSIPELHKEAWNFLRRLNLAPEQIRDKVNVTEN